jgi:hypothetical protein
MQRQTDIEFLEDLIEEFGLNPNQKISTLVQCLADDGADDEDDEDDDQDQDDENEDDD